MSQVNSPTQPTDSHRPSSLPGLIWIPRHPLTWLVTCGVGAALVGCNLECHVFFGPGSTSRLQFSHGWPLSYQQGPVPGPSQRPGAGPAAPNYIWGHPEFNRDEEIMQRIISQELAGLPTTPWGLGEYATVDYLGVTLDLLVALLLLVSAALALEHLLRVQVDRLHLPKRAVWYGLIGIVAASVAASIVSATGRAIVMAAAVVLGIAAAYYCLFVYQISLQSRALRLRPDE